MKFGRWLIKAPLWLASILLCPAMALPAEYDFSQWKTWKLEEYKVLVAALAPGDSIIYHLEDGDFRFDVVEPIGHGGTTVVLKTAGGRIRRLPFESMTIDGKVAYDALGPFLTAHGFFAPTGIPVAGVGTRETIIDYWFPEAKPGVKPSRFESRLKHAIFKQRRRLGIPVPCALDLNI